MVGERMKPFGARWSQTSAAERCARTQIRSLRRDSPVKESLYRSSLQSSLFTDRSEADGVNGRQKGRPSTRRNMYSSRVHTIPHNGGVSLGVFVDFFEAVKTIPLAGIQYETMVRFQFSDGIRTDYRLGCDPVHSMDQEPIPVRMARCPTRPLTYIQIYELPGRDRSVCGVQTNISKPICGVTLSERWTVATPDVTYILTKSAWGGTKGQASEAEPRFDLKTVSDTLGDLPDLFGRYQAGCEEALSIVMTPYIARREGSS